MSKYVIDDTTLSAIGNAIKTKKGDNTAITVSNFATEIANLSAGSSSSFTTTLLSDTSTVWQNDYRNTSLENIIQGNIDKIQSLFIKSKVFILSYTKDRHYQYLVENIGTTSISGDGTYLTGDILYCQPGYTDQTPYLYTGTIGSNSYGLYIPNDDTTKVYESYYTFGSPNRIVLKTFQRDGSSNPLQIWITMED